MRRRPRSHPRFIDRARRAAGRLAVSAALCLAPVAAAAAGRGAAAAA